VTFPPDRSGPANSVFVRACRRQPVERTPVWFMRQAGRSLPEYRALREGTSMLEACSRPDLITEITMQPVRRYGTDAAIFFSDIVLPLRAVGVDVDIKPGVGPVLGKPVQTMSDVEAIPELDPADVGFVTEAVRALVLELGGTPLIGFAGAPFTLASYLVEGGPSRDHAKTKAMMYAAPQVWHALAARLAEISAAFLGVQVAAGACAVQLFDSWAGALSPQDYAEFVQPHSRHVLQAIGATGVPRIHFGVGTGELLPLMGAAGAEVVGVDWRVPLDEASRRMGDRYAVQGNLDPTLVFAPPEAVDAATSEVLRRGRAAPGHIFNLGHGVLPDTDPGVLKRIVERVHEESAAHAAGGSSAG
jgi:uroporphyrinogen decarboxylase